jgi:hypothetical protein
MSDKAIVTVRKSDCPREIWAWLSQGMPPEIDPIFITDRKLARAYQERWREFASRVASLQRIKMTPGLVMAEVCRRDGEWLYFTDRLGLSHAAYCKDHKGDSHAPEKAVGAVKMGQSWFWVIVDE